MKRIVYSNTNVSFFDNYAYRSGVSIVILDVDPCLSRRDPEDGAPPDSPAEYAYLCAPFAT